VREAVEKLIENAQACEREGRLDDAVIAWMELVALVPEAPEPYKRLLDIHLHRREVDAAFCAASMLAALDALEGTARELFEDYVPRRLPAPNPAGLDDDDWALLAHPREAGKEMRSRPKDAIDMASLAWVLPLLGIENVELPPDGAPPVRPRVDLDEIWGNYTLRERLFIAGRAACASLPLTGVRAGVLVCGEPAVAHALLVRERANDELVRELSYFAVSPKHHRLRAKLGLAVGASADAPIAPTPAPAPVVKPPPPRLIAIATALLDTPPRTVRDLEAVLGVTMRPDDFTMAYAHRELVMRGGVEGAPVWEVRTKWRGDTRPSTMAAMRGRALASGWSVHFLEGRDYLAERLKGRADFALTPEHGDGCLLTFNDRTSP